MRGEEELAQTFHEVALVELHHLEIFGALAVQLGAEPRLWSVQRGRRVWWSPEYNQYNRMMGPLLQSAVRAEEASIRIYENQARWIGDENVRANLRRVLADERCHLELSAGGGRSTWTGAGKRNPELQTEFRVFFGKLRPACSWPAR